MSDRCRLRTMAEALPPVFTGTNQWVGDEWTLATPSYDPGVSGLGTDTLTCQPPTDWVAYTAGSFVMDGSDQYVSFTLNRNTPGSILRVGLFNTGDASWADQGIIMSFWNTGAGSEVSFRINGVDYVSRSYTPDEGGGVEIQIVSDALTVSVDSVVLETIYNVSAQGFPLAGSVYLGFFISWQGGTGIQQVVGFEAGSL